MCRKRDPAFGECPQQHRLSSTLRINVVALVPTEQSIQRGVRAMSKQKSIVRKNKELSARKRSRKAPHKLIPRIRKDLQLKDYLMEEHPELGLPLDGAKWGVPFRGQKKARD
jgi:hypothetical protein